ncbi:hypothetical protein ACFLTP_07945 [Chloroflexota bacterium]
MVQNKLEKWQEALQNWDEWNKSMPHPSLRYQASGKAVAGDKEVW